MLVMTSLSACAPGSTGPTTTTQQGPVKIGVSLPFTGDGSADGKSTQQGYDVWADMVNKSGGLLGHQVQMVYYDDKTKTDQSHTNYEKLISVDHVNFVVGPVFDNLTVTGAEVAARHQYAFIEGIGTSPSTFSHGFTNLFSVSLSATKYLASFVDYVLSLPAALRPKTVAYASSDDPFTGPQVETARPLLEAGGVKTALYDIYPAETTDYASIAQKVVAANPDMVVLGTNAVTDSTAFIKAFIQQHFNPKLIIATSGPDQGDAFASVIGPKNTEGLIVPNDGWWPTAKTFQNTEFVKAFVAKYGGTPDAIGSDSVQAFSVGQTLQQAVNKAQSLDNAQVMHALRNNTFQSLQGTVKFGADGQNTADVAYMFQWQGGKLVPVFPNDQAQANAEYPKPAWAAGS
ncbi:MAG: amino acid ABC transporter substrate-binding protein [Chloroflexota bacterium]|nr:amino acid ABC transporter substrate-binding protein [Chloroflexota bacterium]